jgi:hypothetical protein
MEVGLVAGGVSARLVVNDGHEHGRRPEFDERIASPFSRPATFVNLVHEEHNLAGNLRCIRQLAYFEITGLHRAFSVYFDIPREIVWSPDRPSIRERTLAR